MVAVPISIAGSATFGTWMLDFIVAFVLGIAFRYFTIQPMRDLIGQGQSESGAEGRRSLPPRLASRYVRMDGFGTLLLFSLVVLPKSQPTFWFMLQIAMIFGFLTS